MKDKKIILATNQEGCEITIEQIEKWMNEDNKERLADFIYDRLYGRYLMPHDFDNEEYRSKYKNGFAIMASCCLLIETFVSFKESIFLNTEHKSERCFGYFFLTNPEFKMFSRDGLTKEEYLDLSIKMTKKGVSHDFYKNVRCGILHGAETKGGWKILRKGKLFDEKNKSINATVFMETMKKIIRKFQSELIKSDFNDPIWVNYKSRLRELMENC